VLTGGRPWLVGFVGIGNMGRRMAANLAAAGTLSLMVAGLDEDAFARVRPVLETLGERIFRTGPLGFAADHSEAHKQWRPIDLAAEDP
jgi:3-hydroxyisobutyrate dehydrogenase-like beta-hydroxyacid dehydrogenase